ncbi:hypothetical protein [Hyphomicrobium sp. CS1BSMeth3]|uniref:hypothetical protein n=1 Tax=Hyphomicrobium sp. CS1BSMeth3 TaxID=1892844 RepID=UPI0011606E16|nr:hypothetical protein [Hyphomicrobium sp. CS1BSMeth3]
MTRYSIRSQADMPHLIMLEELIGEAPHSIDFYWDFLWKLGYWPYRYDRKHPVSLGDVAVWGGAASALRLAGPFRVPHRDLIRCAIPTVGRAVTKSRFAEQYTQSLSAMEQSLINSAPYIHSKIDWEAWRSVGGVELYISSAMQQLVSGMLRAEKYDVSVLGIILYRALKSSASAVAYAHNDTDENAEKLRLTEYEKQRADLLTRFPAAHKWSDGDASEARPRSHEIRFRRLSSPLFPDADTILYTPVAWSGDD